MARGGVEALHVEGLLDGDRHAVQRPELRTLARGAVGRARGLQRALAVDHDQRVDRPVQSGDALEMGFGRVTRRELPVSYGASKRGGGFEARIHAWLPCGTPRLAA